MEVVNSGQKKLIQCRSGATVGGTAAAPAGWVHFRKSVGRRAFNTTDVVLLSLQTIA